MQKTEKRNLMAALRSKIVEQEHEIAALLKCIAELEKRPANFREARMAVEDFKAEYVGQNAAELWEACVRVVRNY